MNIRRVVTTHANGRSVFADQVPAPSAHEFANIPGMVNALVWATPAVPTVPFDGTPPTDAGVPWVPAPGETRLLLVTFPPDSVFADPQFDPEAAGAEQMQANPGLAERFEPDDPGMHTTDSVDYGIVLSGTIWLELDDGEQVELTAGDIVVQNGTRHAWRVKDTEPATMAFVLIGAQRQSERGA
ncbi:cupin domain-containing protein [Nitriliruptor alkaliphilus]|uniref:cupin domain-containing protein n=1 Tax=Nitriliruptor alkaliphilus TaxID=427918 RepID=UPI00069786A6|nr:cupin domain-containing protein [Nitriliruptor alkaliphilus]